MVPSKIAAGTTLSFTENLAGYTPADFALAFVLNLAGASAQKIEATDAGNNLFAIIAGAEVTAAWKPGRYVWAEILTANVGGEITQLRSGSLSVTPNLALPLDPSEAMKQLALCESALCKLVKTPNVSVTFNNQIFAKRNLKEFMDVRDRLQVRVDAELRALGLSTRGGAKYIATQFQS